MLLLAICILLTTEAFAAYGGYPITPDNKDMTENTAIPLDFLYDMDNRHLKRLHSKFTYNFQQLRRDQPPQLELREENLGEYMHKHPVTTTTEAIPPAVEEFVKVLNDNTKVHGQFQVPIIVPALHDNHKVSEARPILASPPSLKNQEVPLHAQTWNNWNYQSAYPASMPPPPSTPKWEDLRTVLKHHSHSSKSNQHKLSHHHSRSQHTTSVSPVNQESRNRDHPTSPVSLPKLSVFALNTMPVDNETDHRHEKESFTRGHIGQVFQHSFRGKHKFGWDDVRKESTAMSTTTLASVILNRNPPPPVPTLSPWYDGYGK